MSDLKLSLSEEVSINIAIVNISGILDANTIPKLDEVFAGLISNDTKGVILNLSSVDYISTAGWSLIIRTHAELKKQKRELVIASMIPNVSENYFLLEFDKIIKSFETINDAKRTLGARTNP